MGIGLTSIGAMFVLWGLGGVWSFVHPASLELPRQVGLGLCIFSAALQTTALICILPPWRIGSGIAPALWATMASAILVLFLKWNLDLARQMKLWNKLLVVFGDRRDWRIRRRWRPKLAGNSAWRFCLRQLRRARGIPLCIRYQAAIIKFKSCRLFAVRRYFRGRAHSLGRANWLSLSIE